MSNRLAFVAAASAMALTATACSGATNTDTSPTVTVAESAPESTDGATQDTIRLRKQPGVAGVEI